MRADGERMKEVRESHRGMVDGCKWRGGSQLSELDSEP